MKEIDLKKLPVDEQRINSLQGGLFLCKSFSPDPFWIIFGKVDNPSFLKDKIYENDMYNYLYRDKKGYGYLMIPTLPINDKQMEFLSKVYDYAFKHGLRENFNFIIPLLYGLDLINYNDIVEDYKEWYTQEELQDRFKRVLIQTINIYQYNTYDSFVWRDRDKMFKPINKDNYPVRTKCSILTCLLRSIDPEIAANIMSEVLGQKYLKFELV